MLPNNHLEFITRIEPQFVDMMTGLRKEFIMLDSRLREISALDEAEREGVIRCLSLARTKLEESLHYSIKSLCIMGEIPCYE